MKIVISSSTGTSQKCAVRQYVHVCVMLQFKVILHIVWHKLVVDAQISAGTMGFVIKSSQKKSCAKSNVKALIIVLGCFFGHWGAAESHNKPKSKAKRG